MRNMEKSIIPREQIIQASIEFSSNSKARRIRCRNFEKGAEYGYNLAIEKVCEYIKENIDLYAYKLEKSDFPYDYPLTERIVLTDSFEEDVKQAITL